MLPLTFLLALLSPRAASTNRIYQHQGSGGPRHEAGRKLGDQQFRIEEMENRERMDEYDRLAAIAFENKQYAESQRGPNMSPPQGKPAMTPDGAGVYWFIPTSGQDPDTYFLVQVRTCENEGIKGMFGFCGEWRDMYKTEQTSCDISQFGFEHDTDHQVRVRTCSAIEESIEDCKTAWGRKWSRLSDKFRPAAPVPKGPSPEEIQAREDRERARAAKHGREVKRQQLLEANEEARKRILQADMDRRKDLRAREEWKKQRELERQEENAYVQEEAARQVAASSGSSTLAKLVGIKHRAEQQAMSSTGTKVLVETYITGGRNIVDSHCSNVDWAQVGCDKCKKKHAAHRPAWMARFHSSMCSRFHLYPDKSSIKILRNAFDLAIKGEEEEAAQSASAGNEADPAKKHRRHSTHRSDESEPVSKHSAKPVHISGYSPGAYVTVTKGYEDLQDAVAGPLQPGNVGQIEEDVGGLKRYIVVAKTGSRIGQKWGYSWNALQLTSKP